MADASPRHGRDGLTQSLENLDESVEDLDQDVRDLTRKYSFWPTLSRGVVGALGAAVGASIVIGLIVYALQALAGFPFIGQGFQTILNQIQQNK